MMKGKEPEKGRILLQIAEEGEGRCSISLSLRSQKDCEKVAGTLLGAAFGPNGESLFNILSAVANTLLEEDHDELQELARQALAMGMMFAPNKVKS